MELERRLGEEAATRLGAAKQAGLDATRQRKEEMQRAGEALHGEMAEAMGGEWAAEIGSVQSREVDPTQANARLATVEQMRDGAEAARERTICRQLERLARAQARLQRMIKSRTEVRALAVAQRRNLDLELLPGGVHRGRDMTEVIAAELDQLWRAADRRRR